MARVGGVRGSKRFSKVAQSLSYATLGLSMYIDIINNHYLHRVSMSKSDVLPHNTFGSLVENMHLYSESRVDGRRFSS